MVLLIAEAALGKASHTRVVSGFFFVPKTYVGWLEGGMLMARVLQKFCVLTAASLVRFNPTKGEF